MALTRRAAVVLLLLVAAAGEDDIDVLEDIDGEVVPAAQSERVRAAEHRLDDDDVLGAELDAEGIGDIGGDDWDADDDTVPTGRAQVIDDDDFDDWDRDTEPPPRVEREKAGGEQPPPRVEREKAGGEQPPPQPQQPPQLYAEAVCGVVVVAFALNWWVGNRRNEELARAYTKTVLACLQENFSRVGWSQRDPSSPRQQPPQPCVVPPVIYKDGCSYFELWASGRSGCQGCLVTINLRKRQNLFHCLFELLRPSDDVVTVELYLDRGGDACVTAVAAGADAEEALRAAPDVQTYVPGPATPAAKMSEWKDRGLGRTRIDSGLLLLSECDEAVRPKAGIFTHNVIAALDAGSRAGVLRSLHISDQMRFLADTAWQETSAYQAEQKERRERAASLQQLSLHGRRGITLTMRLPQTVPGRDELVHTDEVAALHRMVFGMVDSVRKLQVTPAARAKLAGRREEVLQQEWDGILAERESKRDKARQREDAATSAREEKDRRAAIRRAGPPKPRKVY
eukprot:TRINITY_DN4033_c0_g1_i1.p1 TRINITY_DN4033_c0_g1~~TRINITY_DN4033_c0_g1_i1.p1  ORF type:complete len:530 (+),score=185.90 TRINITY_DN4033_c0_g1_i1:60-1592(+)